ncbi:MAG: VPDSG-CTERM sorting domain-containing protein [Vicinamibacterales bacterium]
MKLNRRYSFSAVLVLATGLCLTSSAEAASIMLTDGVVTETINDGDVDDSSGLAGKVRWSGTVGAFFVDISSTGTTKPTLGTATSPVLSLVVDATSTNPGAGKTLTIWFSEVGFGPSGLGVEAKINSTQNDGTVSYSTYQGAGNVLFDDTGAALTTQGPFGISSFDNTANGGLSTGASPYSLTQKVMLSHVGAGTKTTSFDAKLSVPDGGWTASLLGIALLGLSQLRRRFQS